MRTMLRQMILDRLIADLKEECSKPKFRGLKDVHAWAVLPNGKILDYPPQYFKQSCGSATDEFVYTPFDEETQERCMNYHKKMYKYSVLTNPRITDENIWETVNTPCSCSYRAMYIASRDPTNRIKVVFGSLGFRQPDGSVFYEWG